MSCPNQQGTAPYLTFINEASGEKITAQDWHDIRMLAQVERGQGPLPRGRANKGDLNQVTDYLLSKYDPSEAASKLKWDLEGKGTTNGTLYAVSYLARHGVKETLAKIRQDRHPERGSYAVHLVTHDGNRREEMTMHVSSKAAAAKLVKEQDNLTSYSITPNSGQDGAEPLDQYEAYKFVEEGYLDYREQNTVIPDSTIYVASLSYTDKNGVPVSFVQHTDSPEGLRAILDGAGPGVKVQVTEQRYGYTLANRETRTMQQFPMMEADLNVIRNGETFEI